MKYERLRTINLVSLLFCVPLLVLLLVVLLAEPFEESTGFRIVLWALLVCLLCVAWRTQVIIDRGWLRCLRCRKVLLKADLLPQENPTEIRCRKCRAVFDVTRKTP